MGLVGWVGYETLGPLEPHITDINSSTLAVTNYKATSDYIKQTKTRHIYKHERDSINQINWL